jgi:hypothetical protein
MINAVNYKSLRAKEVSQGDVINVGNLTFYVVWPPHKLNDASLEGLISKINKIDDFLSNHTNAKELWSRYKNASVAPFEIYAEDRPPTMTDKEINTVSDLISEAADYFSVCLYLPNTFLSLGDLHPEETKACLEYITKNYHSNHVSLLIPPHHGTRWAEKEHGIFSDLSIINNGRTNHAHFSESLHCISRRIFSTYINGTVNVDFGKMLTSPNIKLE